MPDSAQAQRACDEAIQHIYRIAETPARQVPDSLQTLLDLAAFFRDCEDDVSMKLELWLLNNEVFALDKLGRYEEALTKVAYFFDTHFDEASDLYRARFHIWRLHFNALSGDILSMIVAYNEATRYAEALDVPGQANFHLDGAYAYREINEFEIALTLINATSQERVCHPNKQGVSTQAPRRNAEGEERVANRKIALRSSLSALRM